MSANQLLYDVARFNFSSFVVRDFDLEPMSFGNVGLLIVKGFGNLKQLEHYRTVMAEKGFELPEGVRPIMISKANFELLLREGRSFEEYFRFEEDSAIDRTEQQILETEADPDQSDQSSDPSDESDESDSEAEPTAVEPQPEQPESGPQPEPTEE